MSKPCPFCGQLTGEQFAFCHCCGHPLTAERVDTAPVVQSVGIPAGAVTAVEPPRKKKNLVGWLIGGGAALIVIGIAIAVLLIFLGGDKLKSPQAVLDRMIDTALDGEYDKALDCIYEYHYSPELRKEATDLMGELPVESLESYGIDKSTVKSMLSLTVKNQEEIDAQDDAAIKKTLTESGVTTDPIEEIDRAEVAMTLFGETESIDLFFVKADGGWYLLGSGGEMNDLGFNLDL